MQRTRQTILLALSMVFLGLLFCFFNVEKSSAWYEDHSYRKTLTIDGSSEGNQADYQLKVVVYETDGADSGNTVYTNGNTNNDYSDIRFTDSNDNLLNYWIEQINDDNAEIWVKFSSIPSTGAEFRMYYGNSTAESVSSFSDTFTMVENGDFETGDFTGWSTYDAYENWGSKGTYTASVTSSDPIEGVYSAYLNASDGDTQVTGKSSDVSGLNIGGWDNKALVFRVNATVQTSGTWPGQPYNFVSAMLVDLIYSDGSDDESYEQWYGYNHSSEISTDFLNNDFSVIDLQDVVSDDVSNESNGYELTTIRINARHKYSTAEGVWDVVGFANYLASNAPEISGWSSIETPGAAHIPAQTQQSTTTSETCSDLVPSSNPDLFQIDTTLTTATLYFTPILGTPRYFVSYSTEANAEEHGARIHLSSDGVQSYTIHSLAPYTTYYFKVRGQNGCMPGGWSNIKSAQTLGVTTNRIDETANETSAITLSPTPSDSENEEAQTEESEDVAEKKYDVRIKVAEEGVPLANAKIELHSNPRYGTTNENGEVLFAQVEEGEHTVKIIYDSYTAEKKILLEGDEKDFDVSIAVELKKSELLPTWGWLAIIAAIVVAGALLTSGVRRIARTL